MVVYFRLQEVFSLNVILVMYVCHIIQQLGASIFLLSDPSAIAAPTYFVACALTALLIPIGGMLGHAVLPAQNRHQQRFHRSAVADNIETRRAIWVFLLLLSGFCLLLFLFYVSQVPSSPLLKLVTGKIGGGVDAQLARREGDAGALGRIFGMGIVFFMPFLFLISMIGLGYFRSTVAKLACIPAMTIAILYNAWAMDKTTVAMLFLLASIILLMKKQEVEGSRIHRVQQIDKKATAKKKRRIWLLFGVFSLLMVGYPVLVFVFTLSEGTGLGYMISHVFLRLVYKPAINSYTAFEAFTYYWNFTFFTDIKLFTSLFGLPYFDMSEAIAVYKGQDPFNNAPPTAIGNFYGQGGWTVLVVGVLFAAALFKVVENWFYHVKNKSPVHIALYALLLYGAFRFSWANYHTILMTETILPLILLLLLWNLVFRVSSARGTNRQ